MQANVLLPPDAAARLADCRRHILAAACAATAARYELSDSRATRAEQLAGMLADALEWCRRLESVVADDAQAVSR